VLAFNLLGDGIRDTLDPKLSPAVLRLMTGVARDAAYAHERRRRDPAPSVQASRDR